MGMNADVKRKWVEALRSGRYEQGTGQLRQPSRGSADRFCCLGVLCDLVEPDQWVYDESGWTHRAKDGLPHVSVVELVGLPVTDSGDEASTVFVRAGDPDREQTSLDRLNDKGWSFAEIADLIEAQL